MNLDVLRDEVATCTKCTELAAARTNTVFGVGPIPSRLMIIGEAPGADEDLTGLPFVGQAGKLLTNIISACGWKREEIFICNILKCRPPANRRPTKQEADNCRCYLDAQIDEVKPKWIICLGATAANSLLKKNDSIGFLRGLIFEYRNAKVVCTYHPAYLLPHRNPAKKKEVWDDLQVVIKDLK